MSATGSPEGYVAVTGGRVWYHIEGTSQPDIPLLALHGGPGAPSGYVHSLTALADERPVILYDQLGSGRSDRPDDPSLWVLDRFVDEVAQVVSALGLTRFHLFGHSCGTMLAVEGREATARFIATAASGLTDTTADEMVVAFQSMSISAANAAAVEVAARWVYEAIRVGLEHGNSGWIDDDLAFCAPWGFDLTRIQVPVLLMHGVQDTLVPIAHSRWLAGHIPDVDTRYFDNDDHMTLLAREFPVARTWLADQFT